jgi:TolA-binding protein
MLGAMDSSFWIWITAAAATSAALGALACFVVVRRSQVLLQDRLVRTEQARNGAVERSAQAREQIAQLNQAIDDLRRTHSMRPAPGTPVVRTSEELRAERRARAEKALRAAGGDATLVLPRDNAPIQAFADTQTLDRGV